MEAITDASSIAITVRIKPSLKARLLARPKVGPYIRPSLTAVVERGIELALDELEQAAAEASQ